MTPEQEALAFLKERGYSVMRSGGGWQAEKRGPRGDVVDRAYGPGPVSLWLEVRDRFADLPAAATWDSLERARLRERCRTEPMFRVEVVESLLDRLEELLEERTVQA